MSSINIDIKGLDAALRDLKLLDKEAKDNCQKALNIYAIDVHRDAVNLVPVDTGKLKGNIEPKFGELEASVTVQNNYAAFIEFGTGKFANSYIPNLPEDWKQLASLFRGGKLVNGIKPQPYLYPASEQNKKKLIDNLKKLFS